MHVQKANRDQPAATLACLFVVGFTLIELLVVVAILGLLISILLPAMSAARDQAKAAVCATNIKECTQASMITILERQQDRMPTNTGWGPAAMFQMSGRTEPFLCPTDKKPSPIPAFLIRMYEPRAGGETLRSIASVDSPFSEMTGPLDGGRYEVNIQDQIDGSSMGGDNDTDVLCRYSAPDGAQYTQVNVTETSIAWRWHITNYRGQTIIEDVRNAVGRPFEVPVLWGSYGMNASAGFRNQKVSPGAIALVVEYKRWAARPESFVINGMKTGYDYPLFTTTIKGQTREGFVRLRHGSGKKANVGFADGHVERVTGARLKLPANPNDACIWHPRRVPGWSPVY